MRAERGTALLITMILTAVIGSISFGIGRTTLSRLQQTARLEDGVVAYGAAQAGLEDGLLRIRLEPNAAVPSGCADEDIPTGVTHSVLRINLSNSLAVVRQCVDATDPTESPDDNDIVYDMKLFRRLAPGQAERISSSGSFEALGVGQSVTYDVRGMNQVILDWQPVGEGRLMATALDDRGIRVGSKELSSGNLELLQQRISLGAGTQLELKAMDSAVQFYQITPSRPNDVLTSRFVHVQSTGYFGVASRKLEALIDHSNGQIISRSDAMSRTQGRE